MTRPPALKRPRTLRWRLVAILAGLAVLIGAIGPSLVAWFVVAPLRGLPVAGGSQAANMARGLFVNGAWGLGLAVFLWLADRVGEPPRPRLDRA